MINFFEEDPIESARNCGPSFAYVDRNLRGLCSDCAGAENDEHDGQHGGSTFSQDAAPATDSRSGKINPRSLPAELARFAIPNCPQTKNAPDFIPIRRLEAHSYLALPSNQFRGDCVIGINKMGR